MGNDEVRTLPLSLWITNRDTVTVAVLFMAPALVTTPLNAIGGIAFCECNLLKNR